MGVGADVAHNLIHEHIPFLTEDVYMAPLMETVRQLVTSGEIKTAVEAQLATDN